MYLLSRRITITGEYLCSKQNYLADQEAQQDMNSSKLKPSPQIFQKICCKVVTPEIDLFVSK